VSTISFVKLLLEKSFLANAPPLALASCLVRVFVSAQHHIQTQLKFAAYRLTALNRVNGNSFFSSLLKGHFIVEAGF